ncbi:hypothetical protein [Flagellimonas onchidii]|uniref:hypothetical protein n=1 Tax=Flagellimonas onchidii TaxID=2562684 RepID=UPI0010A6238B|nr:hypothetical protein [Allomuricauda onchidii]
MGQDLKELFAKEKKEDKRIMKPGHEDRFLSKLEESLPDLKLETAPKSKPKPKLKPFPWLRIAASVVVLLGLTAYFVFGTDKTIENSDTTITDKGNGSEQRQSISLGDLSPDLKKIERYYVTNINLELSGLEFTGENKVIVDSYMARLSELDKEYKKLTVELNAVGPNDDTINALIQNLQLRLQLLQKLKSKLNQLKSSKNEQEPKNMV